MYYIVYEDATGQVTEVLEDEIPSEEGYSYLESDNTIAPPLSQYRVEDGALYKVTTTTTSQSTQTGWAYYICYNDETLVVTSIVSDRTQATSPYIGVNDATGYSVGMTLSDISQSSADPVWHETYTDALGTTHTDAYTYKGVVSSVDNLPANPSNRDLYEVSGLARYYWNDYGNRWNLYRGEYSIKGQVATLDALPDDSGNFYDGDRYWVNALDAYYIYQSSRPAGSRWVHYDSYPVYNVEGSLSNEVYTLANSESLLSTTEVMNLPASGNTIWDCYTYERTFSGDETVYEYEVYWNGTRWSVGESELSALSSRGAYLSENSYHEPDIETTQSETSSVTGTSTERIVLTVTPEDADGDDTITFDEDDEARAEAISTASGTISTDTGLIVQITLRRADWAAVISPTDDETGGTETGYWTYVLASPAIRASSILHVLGINRGALAGNLEWFCQEGSITFNVEYGLRPYEDVVIYGMLYNTGDSWSGKGTIEAWPQGEWKRMQYRLSLHAVDGWSQVIDAGDSMLIQTPINFETAKLHYVAAEWCGNTRASLSQYYVGEADNFLYYRITNNSDKRIRISEVILDIIYQGVITGAEASELIGDTGESTTTSQGQYDEYITDEDIDDVT